MFRWNGAMNDVHIEKGRSHFDNCWIVGSLGANLGVEQEQQTT